MSWVNRERFRDGEAAGHLERLDAAGLRYVLYHRKGLDDGEVKATEATLAAAGAVRAASFDGDDVWELPPPPPVKPFTSAHVATEIQLPARVPAGKPFDAVVRFAPRDEDAVFERGIRTMQLRAAFSLPDGRKVVTRATMHLAPPLLGPSMVRQAGVELDAPKGAGLYAAAFTLTDEHGAAWARLDTQIDVAGPTPTPPALASAPENGGCEVAVVSFHALPKGGMRVLGRYRSPAHAALKPVQIAISPTGTPAPARLTPVTIPGELAPASGVLFSFELPAGVTGVTLAPAVPGGAPGCTATAEMKVAR